MSIRAGLFWIIAALVAMAPLSMGSYQYWPMAAIQSVCAGLALLMTILAAQAPRQTLRDLGPVLVPLGLCALALLWCLVQTVSWTPAAWHHPVWTVAADALGMRLSGAVSVDPAASRFQVMLLLSYLVVFMGAYLAALDSNRARNMLRLGAITGGVYAIYGLGLHLTGADHVLYLPTPYPPDTKALAGPFGNQNHFALFVSMGLICATALFVRGVHRLDPAPTPRLRMARAIEFATGTGLPFLAVIFAGLTTTFLTGSRGALVGAAGVGLVVLMYLMRQSKAGQRSLLLIGAGVGVLVMAGLSLTLAGEAIVEELQTDQQGPAGRYHVWGVALAMIADAPLLGAGLTSFDDLYPLYTDGAVPGFHFRHAHNAYLGLTVSMGLPAALLWLTGLVWVTIRCVRGAFRRRYHLHFCVVPVACTFVIAVHSLVDFGTEMPAIALLWAALLGTGAAQADRAPETKARTAFSETLDAAAMAPRSDAARRRASFAVYEGSGREGSGREGSGRERLGGDGSGGEGK